MRRNLRAAARGFSLIEVMVVVVIIGLIAGATAVAVFHHLVEARVQTTRIAASNLRTATAHFRASGGSECPTVDALREQQLVDRAQSVDDAWGTRFTVECEGEDVTIVSAGPDRLPRTSDDIRVPGPQG